MLSGKIVYSNPEKGFAFIRRDDGKSSKDNVFAHFSRQAGLGNQLTSPKVGDRVLFEAVPGRQGRASAEWWKFIDPAKRYASLSDEDIDLAKEILGVHLAALDLGLSSVNVGAESPDILVYEACFPGSAVKAGTLGQVLLWAWLYAKELKMDGLPQLEPRPELPRFIVTVPFEDKSVMDTGSLPFYLEAQAEVRAEYLGRYIRGVKIVALWQDTPRQMDVRDVPNLLHACELTPVVAHDSQNVRWHDVSYGSRILVATGVYDGVENSRITVDGTIYTGPEVEKLFAFGKWLPEKSLVH